MIDKRRRSSTNMLKHISQVSEGGDIIEMDGEYYIYKDGDPPELVHIDHN